MNATSSEFPANFYDGKSANKYPVRLRLTADQLELVFPDGHQIKWLYSALQLSKTGSTGPVRLERTTSNPDIVPESVVIEDPHFLHEAHRVAPGALGNVWNQPHKRSLRYALMILALVVIPPLIFAIWVYAIPAMTNAVADKIPTKWEEKLGQDYFQTLFKDSIKEPDPQVRGALDAISSRLLTAVPDQPYQFRIYVHPSKIVNAMALPGGTIIVFQGLINATETPEELAGVLAHEFQHVLKRHSTRNIIRSEAIHLFGLIISGNSDSMTNVILQAGSLLEHLRYSRKLESQADAEGMKMMLAARIDPRGMIRVFEKLEEEQQRQLESMKKDKEKTDSGKKDSAEKDKETKDSDKEGDVPPKWTKYLSTHPEGDDRVEVLKKLSEHSTQKPRPLLPDFDWKSMHRETKETGFIF
ncbi:MAG TPA: M48 family metallopeptidase [Desulfobacteria bacterium]|nr:M48 family metallopeptidase [Desulfobacteria bacterium]